MIKTNKEINRIIIWFTIILNIFSYAFRSEREFIFLLRLCNFLMLIFLAIQSYNNNFKIRFFISILFAVVFNPIHSEDFINIMGIPVAIFIYYSLIWESTPWGRKSNTGIQKFSQKINKSIKAIILYTIIALLAVVILRLFAVIR